MLVVEDDPVAAEAHRAYVERLPGFTVAGVVHSGAETVRFCRTRPVDLVLLDFYLPDTHGLAVCRTLRADGNTVDVIAVTSARDLGVVRAAVSAGVVQYLLKPFTFAALRDKLESYARFRDSAAQPGEVDGQAEVDRMLATLRTTEHAALPKGMSGETLEAISAVLADAAREDASDDGEGMSAAAVADAVGVARVTARRYLEYLADSGLARRKPHYGGVGRPEVRYAAMSRKA
ncbi:Response regulator of citrate/malate metabolism [Prauserella flava]|uniref:Transcriptional regulatory protein n=1 Tax=Prauserella sediminis TaxID=577680 RepID=A0A839XND5_9PSEU|nr:response regulator of citrate/malate metabolism [Prauserella sediminis]MCR3722318.1 Response regulator of citrate/malate metabolism [Prauserella flava]MCR3736316.1 Response regulator of citrate/malate metabolism [Prauserella salsuginis]